MKGWLRVWKRRRGVPLLDHTPAEWGDHRYGTLFLTGVDVHRCTVSGTFGYWNWSMRVPQWIAERTARRIAVQDLTGEWNP